MRTQKGFTLIELAVVIAIIAILAAVAIPRFGNTTASAECANIRNMTSQLSSAASIWTAENAATPQTFPQFAQTAALPAGAPVLGSPVISLANFGPNSRTNACAVAAGGITCTNTFNSYSPVTYTYNNGTVTFAATARNGAAVCQ